MGRDEQAYAAFVVVRSGALRRTAFLLAGDWHAAEDLTQAALTKLYVVWRRVEPATAEAYTRQVLLRLFLDGRRRRASTEVVRAELPDSVAPVSGPEDRLVLLAALSALPPRQRAVVVLRFWEDLPVEEVAGLLGISAGTVKSTTSEGLAALRSGLGPSYALGAAHDLG